ncbi:prepilin peptidase [Rickettsiales bacterium]|nr:prepilin peptidase [Rickettsiales bacterium]
MPASEVDFIFGIIIVLIMGLGWGGFATTAIYRLPRDMPWIGDRPRCFMCKHTLNIIDYFAILSFFLLRGKCRYCGGKYECNYSYFVTEIAITTLFMLYYLKYGFGDEFVLVTGLIVGAVMLGVIEAEHKKIPAKILISLLLIGAVYRTFVDGTFYWALYGAIVGGLAGVFIRYIYFSAKGQRDIAIDYTVWQQEDRFKGPYFDYVKFLAVVGVWIKFEYFIIYLAIAGFTIILWNIIHRRSLRLGVIMSAYLLLAVIYPETYDFFWQSIFG